MLELPGATVVPEIAPVVPEAEERNREFTKNNRKHQHLILNTAQNCTAEIKEINTQKAQASWTYQIPLEHSIQ